MPICSIKDTCLNNDYNIGSCQVGWHQKSNGHWNCQTATLTNEFIRDYMMLEEKRPQSNKPKY